MKKVKSSLGDATPDPKAQETPADEPIEVSAAAAEAVEPSESTPELVAESPEADAPEETKKRAEAPPSKRDEVIKRIRAKRDAEDAPAEEEPPAEVDEPAAEKSEKPVEAVVQPRKIKVRVDHADRELTEEELIAAAQKGLAADNRLTEINRITSEARRRLAELDSEVHNRRQASPAHQPEAAVEEPAPTRVDSKINKDRLREVVEKIRYGEDDEGADALESLFEEARSAQPAQQPQQQQAQPSPQEIAAQVAPIIQQQTQIQAAAREFADRHSEIAADPVMRMAVSQTARERMVQALQRHSEPNGEAIPSEWVAWVASAPDANQTFARYHEFKKQGWGVPDGKALYEEAASHIEDKYRLKPQQVEQPEDNNLPSQTETRIEARQAEKRAMTPQPRRATPSRVVPSPPPQKTTGNVVQEMRARRGQVRNY